MRVFIAEHVHEFPDGHEDVKLLGVYSSRASAQSAIDSVRDQPGFREHPSGFSISEHIVDPGSPGWPEGFGTLD